MVSSKDIRSNESIGDWTNEKLLRTLKDLVIRSETEEYNYTAAIILVSHELGKREVNANTLINAYGNGIIDVHLNKS